MVDASVKPATQGEDSRPEDLDRFDEELFGSARVPLSLVERLDELLLALEEIVGLLCTVVTCRCEGDLGGLRAALSELEGTLDRDLGNSLEEALASVRRISGTLGESEGTTA